MGCNSCLTFINDEQIYNLKFVKGLFRFVNTSGECYINSFLQIILHNELILKIINSIEENNNLKLINELKNLLINSNDESIILDSNKIKNIMISVNDIYQNNGGDLNELICDFINELSLELPKKENYSINLPEDEITKNALIKLIKKFYSKKYSVITDIFYGNKMSEYSCKNGHVIDTKFSIFITIDLSIYSFINKNTIYIEEILEDNFGLKNFVNSKFCKICNENTQVNEKEFIYNLPKIIILYIDRVVKDKYYNNKIEFNKDLDFKKYLKNDNNEKNSIYHLFGIIQNNKGHFNCATINNYDKNWYFFNDEDKPLLIEEKINQFNPIALFYSK